MNRKINEDEFNEYIKDPEFRAKVQDDMNAAVEEARARAEAAGKKAETEESKKGLDKMMNERKDLSFTQALVKETGSIASMLAAAST